METEWVQHGMFWATVALAAISVGAAGINYFVFRTLVDPQVVLYVADDRERPTILILVVENIGKGGRSECQVPLF